MNSAAALRSTIRNQLSARFDVDFCFRPKLERELLPGGIPRGAFTEVYGPASSGRTSLIFQALAHLTRQPEFCAYVDAADTFDPLSATQAGIHLPHLLWIRCGDAEHALKAADMLLQGGGFGMLVLDLTGVSPREAGRISLASWFRLRNSIEKTPTAFVVAEEQRNAASCSAKQILCPARNPVSRPVLL